MIPRTVRAIFFDAVGTLIHADPPAIHVYGDVARRLGSQLSDEEIKNQFQASFSEQDQIDRDRGFITSESREAERWRAIVTASLPDVSDPDRAFSDLFSHFAQSSSWRSQEGSSQVLSQLTSRGFQLGIASNFDGRLREVLQGFSEMTLLNHVVISSEVGWRKPGRQFFDAVCRTVDLSPEQILYVGDDWENDYEGARKAGLLSVLFRPQDSPRHDCPSLKRLEELLE